MHLILVMNSPGYGSVSPVGSSLYGAPKPSPIPSPSLNPISSPVPSLSLSPLSSPDTSCNIKGKSSIHAYPVE